MRLLLKYCIYCASAPSLHTYTLYPYILRFDSLQFSVDCPMVPAVPARRVSHDLTLLCEVRRPR